MLPPPGFLSKILKASVLHNSDCKLTHVSISNFLTSVRIQIHLIQGMNDFQNLFFPNKELLFYSYAQGLGKRYYGKPIPKV